MDTIEMFAGLDTDLQTLKSMLLSLVKVTRDNLKEERYI